MAAEVLSGWLIIDLEVGFLPLTKIFGAFCNYFVSRRLSDLAASSRLPDESD